MNEISVLKERLGLLKRVITPDFEKLIAEVDEELGLLQASGILIKVGIHSDALLVLSGMRDYSNHLKGLMKATEAALETAKQQENIDE